MGSNQDNIRPGLGQEVLSLEMGRNGQGPSGGEGRTLSHIAVLCLGANHCHVLAQRRSTKCICLVRQLWVSGHLC